MNIGVIGGGSVGLFISSYLNAHHSVRVYVRREEQCELLNYNGITNKQTGENAPIEALLLENMKKEDLLIICVKQHQVKNILPMIKQKNENTPLLFLQNGMGHIELISHFNQPVYLGVNNHGTLRENDCIFSHTGKGGLVFAHFNTSEGDANRIGSILNNSSFPVRVEKDWIGLLNKKLIVNAVINPLTALFKVSNGEILSNRYLYDFAKGLCYEAAESLDSNFDKNWRNVKKIAEATSQNTSSMLKDIMEKRPTENEAISGYIISKSKKELVYTTFMYKAIQALEYKNIRTPFEA